MSSFFKINKVLDGYQKDMVKTLSDLIRIPAISPIDGGLGEMEKANYLKSVLKQWGFSVKSFIYKDSLNIGRPNLITKYGNKKRTLWIITHLDVVAVGVC